MAKCPFKYRDRIGLDVALEALRLAAARERKGQRSTMDFFSATMSASGENAAGDR